MPGLTLAAEAEVIDLRAALKPLYAAKQRPMVVEVPPLQVLSIEGVGAPADEAFQQAVNALYTCAYTMKFHAKKNLGFDYPVMPLEALWWMAEGDPDSWDVGHPEGWAWRAFIVVPGRVTEALLDEQRAGCAAKAPAAAGVHVEQFAEGRSLQMLHVGPYATEPATLEAMEAFAREQGLVYRGRHHEIYLGDPGRSAPEKLRTILRHPVS